MLTSNERKQLLTGIESIGNDMYKKLDFTKEEQNRIYRYSYIIRKAFSTSRFYLNESIDSHLLNSRVLSIIGNRSCYSFEYNVKDVETIVQYEGSSKRISVSTFEPNYSYLIFGDVNPLDNFLGDIKFSYVSEDHILNLIKDKIEKDKILYKREYRICKGKSVDSTVTFKISLDDSLRLKLFYEVSNKGKLISDRGLRYVSNHMFPLLSERKNLKLVYSKSNVNILEAFDKIMIDMLSSEK